MEFNGEIGIKDINVGVISLLNVFKIVEIYLITVWGKSINRKMKKIKFWDLRYFICKDWEKEKELVRKERWEEVVSGVGGKWV